MSGKPLLRINLSPPKDPDVFLPVIIFGQCQDIFIGPNQQRFIYLSKRGWVTLVCDPTNCIDCSVKECQEWT